MSKLTTYIRIGFIFAKGILGIRKKSYRLGFVKESKDQIWYIDMPWPGDRSNLSMVAGSNKLLDYLKSEAKDVVTIGLTNKDISTSIHGQYNYGIMGLSLRPGNACVVSTFRLKRKDDLWKVTIHELLHSRGLPHCKQDNPRCIMQDAHGKNTYYMKQDICKNCKKRMKSFIQ